MHIGRIPKWRTVAKKGEGDGIMAGKPGADSPQRLPGWLWALIMLMIAAAGISVWRYAADGAIHLSKPAQGAYTQPKTYRIHITGCVKSPGLYDIVSGSRVEDAVALAGGATDNADLQAINLARFIKDGDGIHVPAVKAVSPSADTQAEPLMAGETVDINVAPLEELLRVPGMTKTIAQSIILYREKYGAFSDLEQLYSIKGIGEATFLKISPYLVIE